MLKSESQLQEAFIKGLNLPKDADFQTLEFAKSKGWDSIAHLKLVAAIENEFDIMMDTKDMLAMSSYIKAKEIVSKYGHSFS